MEDKNTGGIADVTVTPIETAAPPKVALQRPVRKAVQEPRCGKIVYYSKERGYMGFECEGRGYQIPFEEGYRLGGKVEFTVVSGKVVLHK